MLISCVNIQGNDALAGEWRRFTVEFPSNRLFRSTLRLKYVQIFGQKSPIDLFAPLADVVELRLVNSLTVLKFYGNSLFSPFPNNVQTIEMVMPENLDLFITNLYTQTTSIEMEYRFTTYTGVLLNHKEANVEFVFTMGI